MSPPQTLLQFRFTNEGAALAFNYLNSLIHTTAGGPLVTRVTIQMHAAACILLASKMDGTPVGPDDLRTASQDAFTVAELLKAEVDVLHSLHFGLITVTPFEYIEVLVPSNVPMEKKSRRTFIQHAEFFELIQHAEFNSTKPV